MHVGGASTDSVELLLAFIRIATTLLPFTGSGRNGYWGAHATAVQRIARLEGAEASNEAVVRVALARSQARSTAEAALREARSRVATSERVHTFDQVAACPVCGCLAGWMGDWDDRGGADAFVPDELDCAGCHLWLRGRAELDLAAAPEYWKAQRPDSQRALWNGGVEDEAPMRRAEGVKPFETSAVRRFV